MFVVIIEEVVENKSAQRYTCCRYDDTRIKMRMRTTASMNSIAAIITSKAFIR